MESNLKEATKREAGGLCASVWRGMLLFMLLLLPGGRLWAQDGWKAQETNPQNYLYWVNGVGYGIDATSGTAKVVESAKDLQGNVSLPSALTITRSKDGAEFSNHSYTVTAIGEKAFAERSSIASIFLGSGVTDIKGEAFKGCSQLKKVIYVGASVPNVAADAFEGAGVSRVEAAAGGEIVFTTPTGHGKLNATLNGKLIGSGTPAEKGELVVTATAAEHYMVASNSRRGGAYTTSEVGVTVDGEAVNASEVELDGEGRSVTVKLQLDGTAGKRVEVAFMPQMVKVDYGVLQSQARVFRQTDNRSSELHYENGGTLTASVGRGEEVEYGARVDYTAKPGKGATLTVDEWGNSVWAVESWRVGGEKVAGVNGTSFSRLADGQQVQVRFKRTKFLIRCNLSGSEANLVYSGQGSTSEGEGMWVVTGASGEFSVERYWGTDLGIVANGVWVRGKEYKLLEDTYVDAFISSGGKTMLIMVTKGPGVIKVRGGNGAEQKQRAMLRQGESIDVTAIPNDGAELRSLTIQGAQVPVSSPKDGVKNLSTTVPSVVLRVFATFSQPGQQIMTIAEEGLCRVTVLRDGRELRNGDEVRPGDRLKIAWKLTTEEESDSYFKLVSLTVNGAPFTSGDEFVVGNDDVNISAIAGKCPKNTKPSFLSYRVFGPGNVKFTRFDSWGQRVALVAGSLIDGKTFTPTATPDAGARLVRLTANGKDIKSGKPFTDFSEGENVYVEAVFAKSDAYVCLQKVTGSGYIKVLRHGERLRPGAPVVAGEQLTIVAKPSVKAGVRNELKLLTVNGVPWESGREYMVPDGQDVSVEAIFGSKDDHMVLLSQRGEGYVTLKKERGVSIDKFPYLLPNGEKGPFEVNATPTSGWKLESLYWGDQAIASGASGLLVGDDDITVFAHFVQEGSEEQHLYLPIVSGGKVVVTRDGKSVGSAATITAGEELTITAQPESGYRVVGPIYVNGEPFVGTQYEVPAKGNVEVKASFAKLGDVILSLVNVGDGVLQAEQDGKVVRHGGVIGTRDGGGVVNVKKDVVVSAKPGERQQLVSLTVEGKTVNATESNGYFTYKIEAALINDDVTVRAVFGPQGAQVLTIDVEGNAGGSVKVYKEAQAGGKEPLNSGSVVSGATLSFEVKAAEGWKLTKFLVNGAAQDPSKTFQVGRENVLVWAKFEKVDYTLSVETLPADGSRGTVKVELAGSEVNSGATIHIGERLTVTTEPKPGNEVKGVSVTGAKQVGADEYEVLRDTKVAVTFGELGKPVLFVDVQPNGAAGKVEVLDAAGAPVEVGTALTKGAQLKVTATPEAGYKLAQLTLNGVGIHSPESITVGDKVKIVAYFEKETSGSRLGLYRLIEGGGKGTVEVTRNGEQVYDGAETLRAGDELSITATPDGGSRFVTLQVNGVEVSNPREGYVVQGAVTVKAVFAQDGEYAMSIAESGPGKVEVRRNGQILLGGETVKTDDRLEITAVPDANAHTSSLTVDGQPFVSGQSVKVTNHDIRIEAAFAADSDPMILTLRSTGGGVLRVIRKDRELGQNEKLAKDDALTVVAKPDEGYRLDLLLVNGKQQASGYVHTVAEGESVTAEARFAKNDTKTLQLLPGVGGMLVAKDRGTNAELVSNSELHEGQNIDIIATANPGNTINEIKINGVSHPAAAAEKTVEYTVIAADKTVIVEGSFEQKEYQLNAIALGGDGKGNVVVMRKGVELTPESSKVRYGEELKIAVTPTDGKCEGVWVNDVRLPGESPYRYQVGTSDVTIRVLFVKDGSKKIRYTYEVRKEGGAEGSLTVTKEGETQPLAFGAELAGGDVLHIKAAAGSDSYLSSLTVNGEEQDVKATEVVWTVPTTVAGGAVNVVAEFLPIGQQKLEVLANGPGEVRVTSMDGLKLYPNGSLVPEGTTLLVTVNPNAGSICKLFTINGAAQELVNNQVSFKVVKEGAKIWAEFGSSAEYKLYYQNPVVGIITVTDVTQNSKLESGAVLTQGQKLRIEAAPRSVGSYALKELKVNGEAKASGVEIGVGDKDVLVEALFAKARSLTVTVNPTAVGSDKVVVKDAKTGQVLNEYVAEGQEIEVEADKTVPGYNKDEPSVVINGQPTTKHTVGSEDVAVAVAYTLNEYTLTVKVEGNPNNGGATVKVGGRALTLSEVVKGTATVKYGDELTVEPVAVAGYNAAVSPASPITVADDVTVVVSYTAQRRGWKAPVVEPVALSGQGGVTVTDDQGKKLDVNGLVTGQKIKIEATVVAGYDQTAPTVAVLSGLEGPVDGVYTVKADEDVQAKVTYTPNRYTLEKNLIANAPAGASYSVVEKGKSDELSEVYHGQAIEVQVTPVNGYTYEVTVEGASKDQDGSYTVTGAVKVTVTYTAKEYTLTVAVDGNANGGATVKVGGTALTLSEGVKGTATVKYGDELTVEAVAVAGYNAAVSPASPITVTDDVTVEVRYTAKEYKLTVAVEGNANGGATVKVGGTALTLSEGVKGTATVKYGDEITVEPVAVAGYNAVVSPASPITVADDVTVVVSYTAKEYTLTVVKVGVRKESGEVLVAGVPVANSVSVEYGAKVKVSAAAKQGEEKVTVEMMQIGDKVYYSGEEQEVTVTGDLKVTVNFGDVERLTLATSVVPEGTGKVTVKAERNGGEVELSENDELVAGERLTISAEGQRVPDLQQPGKEVQYRLQVIKVNGAAYTSHDLPLQIKVTTKVVIEAQFEPENASANEVRLVTSVKGSGKGKVEVKRKGEPKPLAEWSVLHKGDVLKVAATPDGTDELLSLNVSGEERQNGEEYIVTGVEPDGLVKVEATFVKAGKLGFSVVSGANGRVEVWRDGKRLAHDAELTKGEKLTITAVPLPGYVCTRLEVDGMPFVGGDEYTVEHSFKVYAEFGEADKQSLVVDCGAHGSVKVMRGDDEVKSSGTVQQGDELTITATPASAEYELSVLTVNGEEKAPSPATYTVGAEPRVEVKARFRTLKAGVKSVVILSTVGGRVEAHDANGTRYRDGDEVQVGVKLTVTAEASRGYRLEKLTVNAEKAQAGSVEYTVADGDKEVLISAVFTRVPYKLEVVKKGDAEADGEVAVKVNGKDVAAPYTGVSLYRDDAVEFVPSSANSDVECASVNVNGRAMRTQPYVYTVVDSDVKAVVVFTNKKVDPKPVYLYTDVPNGHGTLVIDGEATKDIKNGDAVNVAEEKALTLTAAPEAGYRLDRLTVNGERVESGAAWQIPSGVEKIEVVAEFVQENAYRLTIAKFGDGEVTVASKENPTVTYSDGDWLREGQELVVTAKAEGTNRVKALTINGKLVEGAGSSVSGEYTVAKEDVKVQAAFGAANEYMLIVACGQEGKVVVTDADGNALQPMAKLTEGQKLKVTAEATATGYGLKRLVVNGESVARGSELEVKSDVVVMAEFARAYRLSIAVTPQELTEHVAVKNAEGQALRDGDEIFLGDAISVNVEDVNGYKVESKVDGANEEASGQWVVTGNVKVDVVYEKVLHKIVVELRDEAEQPIDGAAVLVAGYEVIEAGNGDYTVQLPDGSYKVTAKKEGYEDAELDVTVGGEDKKVTLTLRLKEKTAVESVLLSAVTLTPNPASVVVRLLNAEAAKSYAVYTLRGVEVMRGVLAGESVVAIDVTSLADGVYLLRVEATDGARVLRFVVAR